MFILRADRKVSSADVRMERGDAVSDFEAVDFGAGTDLVNCTGDVIALVVRGVIPFGVFPVLLSK